MHMRKKEGNVKEKKKKRLNGIVSKMNERIEEQDLL